MGTKTIDSARAARDLAGCTLIEGNLIVNIRRGGEWLPFPFCTPWRRPQFPPGSLQPPRVAVSCSVAQPILAHSCLPPPLPPGQKTWPPPCKAALA